VTLERCKALNSTTNGGIIVQGVVSNIRISGGGRYTGNATYGIQLNTTSAWQNTQILGTPNLNPNGAGQIFTAGNGGVAYALAGSIPAPAVPATGVSLQNPYGIYVRVAIQAPAANTLILTINTVQASQAIAAGTNYVPIVLAPGDSIILTYAGGAPTWIWNAM
jgi:hypothetical protein